MRGEVHILVFCPIDTLQWGRRIVQWFIQQMASTYNMLVCWKNPETYYICTYKIYTLCLCSDMQWFIWPAPLITRPIRSSLLSKNLTISSQYQAEKNLFIHIVMLICFFPMCWHWPNLTTIMVFPIPMNMPNSPYQANPINGIFMRAMNTPIQTSHQCLIGNQWYSLKFARAHWWARISQHEPTGLKNEKHISASDSGTWVPEREQQCNM